MLHLIAVFHAKGCSGRPAVLGGSDGKFGIDAAQYVNNMRCDWKIQVEPTKVWNLEWACDININNYIYIYSYHSIYGNANVLFTVLTIYPNMKLNQKRMILMQSI